MRTFLTISLLFCFGTLVSCNNDQIQSMEDELRELYMQKQMMESDWETDEAYFQEQFYMLSQDGVEDESVQEEYRELEQYYEERYAEHEEAMLNLEIQIEVLIEHLQLEM